MAKIQFNYSVMNAGKSLHALQLHFSLTSVGFKPLLMKPAFDTRDDGFIRSRIGLEKRCWLISPTGDLDYVYDPYSHIIVDEAQFLPDLAIEQLRYAADVCDKPVYLFGLRTSYLGELFPATAKIMAIADEIQEIKSMYSDGELATMHIRYIGDTPVFDGDPTIVGDLHGEERYVSVSRKEYYNVRRGVVPFGTNARSELW